jgi:hypothetical protein
MSAKRQLRPWRECAVTRGEVERAFAESTLAARIQAGVPQGHAKRQHFTPQLVLRRFLAPASAHLCQLDVATGQPRSVTVPSAALRPPLLYVARHGD